MTEEEMVMNEFLRDTLAVAKERGIDMGWTAPGMINGKLTANIIVAIKPAQPADLNIFINDGIGVSDNLGD